MCQLRKPAVPHNLAPYVVYSCHKHRLRAANAGCTQQTAFATANYKCQQQLLVHASNHKHRLYPAITGCALQLPAIHLKVQLLAVHRNNLLCTAVTSYTLHNCWLLCYNHRLYISNRYCQSYTTKCQLPGASKTGLTIWAPARYNIYSLQEISRLRWRLQI